MSSTCHKQLDKRHDETALQSQQVQESIMEGKVSLLYIQVGVAEDTSVAVGFAIRATVGHVIHGADSREFFEVLAKGLHTEGRY